MPDEKTSFTYTYSAAEQAEIRQIRGRYEPPTRREESDLERLRRLDASVTRKGTVASLILGIAGTLILGLGMSLIMTDLGTLLGGPFLLSLLLGLGLGAVGLLLVALAYPVYGRILKKERERLAPEILRLTDRLMK